MYRKVDAYRSQKKTAKLLFKKGNPAVFQILETRPVAFRPRLSAGVAFTISVYLIKNNIQQSEGSQVRLANISSASFNLRHNGKP